MLNAEKYRDEILDLCKDSISFGFANNKIMKCRDLGSCGACQFNGSRSCGFKKLEWLLSEYEAPKIDWSKVAVDTKVVCRSGDNLVHRYFSHYIEEDDLVATFPYGRTSFSHEVALAYDTYKTCKVELFEEE